MVANLQKVGPNLLFLPREVAGAGQQEINYRFNTLQHGDDLMKAGTSSTASPPAGKVAATHAEAPIADDNGTGMHCWLSPLWRRQAAV